MRNGTDSHYLEEPDGRPDPWDADTDADDILDYDRWCPDSVRRH